MLHIVKSLEKLKLRALKSSDRVVYDLTRPVSEEEGCLPLFILVAVLGTGLLSLWLLAGILR